MLLHIWSKLNEVRIKTLHPEIREDVRSFIHRIHRDYKIILRITQGTRTFAQQNAAVRTGEKGEIVDLIEHVAPGYGGHLIFANDINDERA